MNGAYISAPLVFNLPSGPCRPTGLAEFLALIPREEVPWMPKYEAGPARIELEYGQFRDNPQAVVQTVMLSSNPALEEDLAQLLRKAEHFVMTEVGSRETLEAVLERASIASLENWGTPEYFLSARLDECGASMFLLSPQDFRVFYAMDRYQMQLHATLVCLNPGRCVKVRLPESWRDI